MKEDLWTKLNSDKKIYMVVIVILACVIGFAIGKMQTTLPSLPTDEDDITYANAVLYVDGIETNLQYAMDEDEAEDFLEIWHTTNWNHDRAHSGDTAFEQQQNVLYMFSVGYLIPWGEGVQTLWIYFCEDDVMYIDDGVGGNEVFYETDGRYEDMLHFFDKFEYTSVEKA